jgi:putative hemolysin
MQHSISWKWIGLFLATIGVISACSALNAPVDEEVGPAVEVIGLANPAAVYCAELGYETENVTREGGEDADCLFPDGSRCPQWEFFLGRCGSAFSYCATQGYLLEVEGNLAICRFPDGSACEEFQFFSGDCAPGEMGGEADAETEVASVTEAGAGVPSLPLLSIAEARDFLAAYLSREYRISPTEEWIEQDITPGDAVGSSTMRYISGPLTIVISALASAPGPSTYTIDEATDLANGFFWQGEISAEGEVIENRVVPPVVVLRAEDARDAAMAYLQQAHGLSAEGGWIDEGMLEGEPGEVRQVFSSGPYRLVVEFMPAAPFVPSYSVTITHDETGMEWMGEVSSSGEVLETSYSG